MKYYFIHKNLYFSFMFFPVFFFSFKNIYYSLDLQFLLELPVKIYFPFPHPSICFYTLDILSMQGNLECF